MTTNRQFSSALKALVELRAEVASPQLQSIPAAPNLSRVLSEMGPLPREALFFGIAPDGLPVLLNLHNSIPGPLLITGDTGSGKTSFLQMITQGVQQTHRPEDVQFAVITGHPDEWKNTRATNHRIGIFSVYANASQDFLLSIANWAHANKSKQSILLLIDDLETLTNMDSDALQNFRWLLLRGPSHRVWPIVTLSAERYGAVLAWIPMFRTRIFGRIEKRHIADALGADQASELEKLEAGIQFSLRENGNWLRFWSPSCSDS